MYLYKSLNAIRVTWIIIGYYTLKCWQRSAQNWRTVQSLLSTSHHDNRLQRTCWGKFIGFFKSAETSGLKSLLVSPLMLWSLTILVCFCECWENAVQHSCSRPIMWFLLRELCYLKQVTLIYTFLYRRRENCENIWSGNKDY